MKKVSLLIVMLILAFSAVVFAQTIPADKQNIDLKASWSVDGKQKPVIFKHETHAANLKCDSCHAAPDGGDKIAMAGDIKGNTNKNAAHNWCWSCHAKQDKDPVKKVCTKCHNGK